MTVLRTFLVLGGFCLMLQTGTAEAIEPGEYKGEPVTSEGLTLLVRPNSARVRYIGDSCIGEVEGRLTAVSSARWQLRATEMPECVVDLVKDGSNVEVKEGAGCIGLHGVSCSFDGTLIGKTGVAPAGEGELTSRSAGALAQGRWVYDIDPIIGLSAHIRTAEGAVGIACISDGSNSATAEILSVRVTSELAGAHGSLYMFKGKEGALALKVESGRPFVEIRDTTCGISLDSFRSAKAMYLVNGAIAGGIAIEGRNELTIDQAGKQTVITSGADASAALGGKTISLKGSAAAIKELLRACPAAQYDIETNCGL